jgi:hypothetical protein
MSAAVFHHALTLDDRARIDHSYLTPADDCRWLAEYASGPGYRGGRVNRLICNLKCSPSIARRDPARRRHKLRAIETAATAVRAAVSRSWAQSATWIPIPPSQAPGHHDYDDRLLRILQTAFAGYDADVRVILYQSGSQPADHARERRIELGTLYESIRINWDALAARPLRQQLVLFDDVLTTGKHYKCCERRLRGALPEIAIGGLFLARRVLSGHGRRAPGHDCKR